MSTTRNCIAGGSCWLCLIFLLTFCLTSRHCYELKFAPMVCKAWFLFLFYNSFFFSSGGFAPLFTFICFLFRRICSPFYNPFFSLQEDDIPDKTVMQVLPIQGTFIVVRSSQTRSDVLQQSPSANHCDHNLIIFSWRRLIKQQLSDAAWEVGQTADEPKQSKKMPFTLSAFLSLSKCQTHWNISGYAICQHLRSSIKSVLIMSHLVNKGHHTQYYLD